MRGIGRRQALGLIGATALTGCAAPDVVSRDGKDPFEGGIGGTGIVGVLTDFGSLRINGLRVELTSATRVRTGLGFASDTVLSPGQALTVVATRSADRLVARHVQVTWPLVGTLRREAGGLTVNGAPVALERGAAGAFRSGSRVAVSGLWGRTGVIASRLDPAPVGPDLLAGAATVTTNGLSVEGVPVALAQGLRPPPDGQYVTLTGRHNGSAFAAEGLRLGRFQAGASALRQLSIEGYLEPVARAPGFRIAGLGHSFARDLRLGSLAQRRAIYFGGYDGLFGARTGYVVPEDFGARRRLLRDGFDGFDGAVVRTR